MRIRLFGRGPVKVVVHRNIGYPEGRMTGEDRIETIERRSMC